MRKEDACKQPREVLHERRKQAIGIHRKGVGVMEVEEMTGLSGTAVNTALCLHGAGASATSKYIETLHADCLRGACLHQPLAYSLSKRKFAANIKLWRKSLVTRRLSSWLRLQPWASCRSCFSSCPTYRSGNGPTRAWKPCHRHWYPSNPWHWRWCGH